MKVKLQNTKEIITDVRSKEIKKHGFGKCGK